MLVLHCSLRIGAEIKKPLSILLDLLGPRQSFEGGLFLTDYKSATAKRPIETLAAQRALRVPLVTRRDLPTQPCVQIGDRVLAGQRIAIPTTSGSLPVHAPTSGEIVEFTRTWSVRDGFVPCVVLEPDARDEAVPQPSRWEDDSFSFEVADLGVMCPATREPLHTLLAKSAAAGVTDLIINAVETEPYLTADLRTLVEEPGRLIDAVGEIADAMGVFEVYFALPYRHRRVVKRIESEARGRFIQVMPLAHKYPQCNPIVLTKTLLNREVPPGGSPLDVQTLVLPLSAVRMTADAILNGRPVTHVIMSVAGDAVEHPGTYRVPIGMTATELAQRVGILGTPHQVTWGGPLSGIALQREEAVVTIDSTAMLMFLDPPANAPVPCIRCGWCVEDCPVGLDPTALIHLEAEETCRSEDLNHLRACVDCGLCSHVCPSQLPLAQSIWRARQRFEGGPSA